MEANNIYNMDCLLGLKQLETGSVDLVVTDPPYRVTPRGNNGTMSGYWASDIAKKGTIFEHNNIEIEEYLPELYRVLKADAHCYIMCNNLNMPHFFDVIEKSDFKFVKLLVWDKQTKICGKYYMGQIEFIFLLRKGRDKIINNCGCSDLLSFPNKKDKREDGSSNIHDSQKPIGLMQTLIENSSDEGELVLDPFMGSGTTALACINSNRKFIGFEINSEFYEIASNRIKEIQSQSQSTLF